MCLYNSVFCFLNKSDNLDPRKCCNTDTCAESLIQPLTDCIREHTKPLQLLVTKTVSTLVHIRAY